MSSIIFLVENRGNLGTKNRADARFGPARAGPAHSAAGPLQEAGFKREDVKGPLGAHEEFGVAAGVEAFDDAGATPQDGEDGVELGSGRRGHAAGVGAADDADPVADAQTAA